MQKRKENEIKKVAKTKILVGGIYTTALSLIFLPAGVAAKVIGAAYVAFKYQGEMNNVRENIMKELELSHKRKEIEL